MHTIQNIPRKKNVRKLLRNNATMQEIVLWSRLRKNRFGYKFRRQHPIGPYVVDFYCPGKKLIVEVDGYQHRVNEDYDDTRTAYFENLGIKVVRFWNNEVNENIEGVLLEIEKRLNAITPPPAPSSSKEGRKRITVFGNPDLEMDNLPIRILPSLREAFPEMEFVVEDPNNLDLPDIPPGGEWIIIDTVAGIKDVTWLAVDDIAKPTARLTAHDYDLASYLLLARKALGDLPIRILGVPMGMGEDEAAQAAYEALKGLTEIG